MAEDRGYREPINYDGSDYGYADHMIKHALQTGAALTIEVAGAKKPRYNKKSAQATTARACLEYLTDGGAKIYAGFVHSNGSVDLEDDKGLDFVMRINSFDRSILREAFKDMLDHPHLGDGEINVVDRALEKGKSFSLGNLIRKTGTESRILGIRDPSYNASMADIIGLCTELYTSNLLEVVYEIVFQKKIDPENRFPFYCEAPAECPSSVMRIGESDVLVVASEDEILKTLNHLKMSDISLHPFNEKIDPI